MYFLSGTTKKRGLRLKITSSTVHNLNWPAPIFPARLVFRPLSITFDHIFDNFQIFSKSLVFLVMKLSKTRIYNDMVKKYAQWSKYQPRGGASVKTLGEEKRTGERKVEITYGKGEARIFRIDHNC